MAITTPASGELRLALAEILVRDNVRDLDDAHVDNLAQSIALRGLLVPLIVRSTDAGYELVAGYPPSRRVPQAGPVRRAGRRPRQRGLERDIVAADDRN